MYLTPCYRRWWFNSHTILLLYLLIFLHMYSKHYYFKNKICIQSLLLLHAVAPQSRLVSTLVSLHSSLNSNQRAPSKTQGRSCLFSAHNLAMFPQLTWCKSSSPYNALQGPALSDSHYLLI